MEIFLIIVKKNKKKVPKSLNFKNCMMLKIDKIGTYTVLHLGPSIVILLWTPQVRSSTAPRLTLDSFHFLIPSEYPEFLPWTVQALRRQIREGIRYSIPQQQIRIATLAIWTG